MADGDWMVSMVRFWSEGVMAVPEGRPVRLDAYRDSCNFLRSSIGFALTGGLRIDLAGGEAEATIEEVFGDVSADNAAFVLGFAGIGFSAFDGWDLGIEDGLHVHGFLSELDALPSGL